MNRSTPGLPVHHQLPEFTQTHVHRVGDAIQPSHPLSSPSPPAPSPSHHQSLFQWVNSLHEVAKVWSLFNVPALPTRVCPGPSHPFMKSQLNITVHSAPKTVLPLEVEAIVLLFTFFFMCDYSFIVKDTGQDEPSGETQGWTFFHSVRAGYLFIIGHLSLTYHWVTLIYLFTGPRLIQLHSVGSLGAQIMFPQLAEFPVPHTLSHTVLVNNKCLILINDY